ncbi:SusC/RagA family TonB-linked outer membrane protein [Pedobacter hiemivivus]|uniref:SusC/RagA family TonB-linked outer membrane protein n=2 Tax=Pedobacter hiemivivus TaxID=2530454 RepID=A0A4U1GPI1_9SPHI|nr:SusC/RagA family TonB-linked outer membrane protein [Pedobacter hiemivivus]
MIRQSLKMNKVVNTLRNPVNMKNRILKLLLMLVMVHSGIYAQNKPVRIRGLVTERSTGAVIPGVSIIVNNKAVGQSSNQGTYSISVPEGSEIKFRIVGYEEVTGKVKPGSDELNIQMTEKTSALQETIIRGYVSTSRETDAGSSKKLDGKNIQDVPVANIESLLQGQIAGLNVQVNTGAPGYRGTVLIRGVSNIDVVGNGEDSFLNPTSPLYVIDGIPIDAESEAADNGFNSLGPGISPLSMIAPEDVASIEVLKDAQATSLYGSRGAYGVILITTRQGNSSIPRLRYSSNFFISTPPKLRSTLGGAAERDFKIGQILKYGSVNDIINRLSDSYYLSDSLSTYYNNSTDWQKVFYGPQFNQQHNLAIEGGVKEFIYKTNLGLYNEKGILANTGFNRYTLNSSFTYKPSAKFSVYANIFGGIGKKNKGSGVGLLQNGIARNTSASSLLPPPSLYSASSDVIGALQVQNDNSSKNLRTSFQVNYQPTKKINLSTTGSYDTTTGTEDSFTPAAANGEYAKAYAYHDSKYTVYNRNNISYNTSFKKSHELSISAFNEVYIKSFQSYAAEQTRLPVNSYIGPIGYSGDFVTGSSRGGGMLQLTKSRLVSFAGSIVYNYKRKYVFNGSYRFDASSFSGEEDPYSKNPSVGLRYNFSKEKIFDGASKWLEYASLKASWGKSISPTGNVFAVNGTYENKGTYNGLPITGLKYDFIPNPALGAATRSTYNFGLEGGLFKGRISFSFDAYSSQMDQQTRELQLNTIIGYNKVLSNEVGLTNFGYEGDITIQVLPPKSKLRWVTKLNGSMNTTYLTKLPGGVSQIVQGNTVFSVGKNPFSYYFFKNNGVYASDTDVPINPKTGLRIRNGNNANAYFQGGDPIIQDLDGDYVITDKDRVAMGNSQPTFTGGFINSFGYGNWSLNINCSFTIDRDVINAADASRLRMAGDPFGTQAVLPIDNLNYWKKPGDRAKYPDALNYTRAELISPFRTNQSLFMEDGSYFKVNNMTLGYVFNRQLVQSLSIKSLRVFTTINNVITFSNYSGSNPENVSNTGYDNSGGYPMARTYSLGLNVEF